MSIQLYNTMSGRKEPLQPIEPGVIRFYACGPTVYNYFHLGNARMFVVFDTIRRYLEYRGYQVRFVQNFTDVDDKIIQRAHELGTDVRAVADRYIEAYFEDADALGIRRATVHPRVTECVPDIIAFIEDLVRKKHAYVRHGDVYFDTSSFEPYGKLSNQSVEDLRAGNRIDVNEEKDDPSDFALWKATKPGEEFWESPWGPGRPGWHIECSVMNAKYLGDAIDIHAGGRDLVFPHHENEIAQSEARTGHTFARYWLHNGTLDVNGEKMSKSLGNFVMTRDVLARRTARAIRFFLLSAHYRHPLNYSEEIMDQAEQSLERIDRSLRNLEHRKTAIQALPDFLQGESDEHLQSIQTQGASIRSMFVAAMDDDFNTADGVAAVFEGVRAANQYLLGTQVTVAGIDAWAGLVRELLDVLGLQELSGESIGDEQIQAMIDERNAARKKRDFGTADALRSTLEEMGVILEDTPQGTRWYKK